ncbi:alpha/beta hydrolase [Pseudorhodoferax sp. Leaf265]|uniref:alpha/beta hydrolase n=1 Tax=Pseudorhodoferax sp. Leaf265 TaxID=1736315 RepID=UPI0006FCAD6C|nr:alpha/beta hydrolase [Pseudorhodoferax sp. Leaf265]KQP19752.1 esterase [Pseudorhodoferax sp. Leaf265]PZP92887.1 MAG: alpha/beta hydrolase [Variovorax paradoxus]PZQ03558.1 MAG: alpha/beta hydrolase [Variovorax paradoxus]
MPEHDPAWYDAQYHTRAAIPEHPQILQYWTDASKATRGKLRGKLDLRYGEGTKETLDLFPAAQPNAPVLVYIHGGFWRALDKRDHSFVAEPFVAAGVSVVLPNYALAPYASIAQIVQQMVKAVAWIWREADALGVDRQRIALAGHSAGGHLAAMLLACNWRDVERRMPAQPLRGALALSGLYELEPLRHAPFLAPDLKLTEASALQLSPAWMPAPAGPLLALVGGEESAEFQRQNALIRERWGEAAVPVCETVPGRNHMNVLHELADPAARAHRLALGLLGL